MHRFVGHVPLVRLPPGQERLALDDGELHFMQFDEWHFLDDAFPYADSSYEQTAPVFLEVAMETPGLAHQDTVDLVEAFEAGKDAGTASLRALYDALLLVTGARLPQPELSVSYLVSEGGDLPSEVRAAITRRVGPANRGLIVFGGGQQMVMLNDANIGDVIRAKALLMDGKTAVTGLVTALTRTTRPGFGLLNEALHLVVGLEALLVRRHEPVTATFGRRYSVLAAEADPREYEALGRALYALRSDLTHGRDVDRKEPEGRAEFLSRTNRPLTCDLALRALRWFAKTQSASVADFHAALDVAFESRDAFDTLRPILQGLS